MSFDSVCVSVCGDAAIALCDYVCAYGETVNALCDNVCVCVCVCVCVSEC